MSDSGPGPRRPIDVPFLLHATELLPGDPQVDDLGPLYAAISRVYAKAIDRDVYGSDHLKAAALLHTLVQLPCLEHSNEAFAWYTTEAFLSVTAHQLDYPAKAAVALVHDCALGTTGVRQISRQLHAWTTA